MLLAVLHREHMEPALSASNESANGLGPARQSKVRTSRSGEQSPHRSSVDAARTHDADAAALERTWTDEPTLIGWITTVDHKAIGRRFVLTALAFFIAAGVLAALMRAQLALPASHSSVPICTTSCSQCTARR